MADSITLGAYHLANNPTKYEPQTGNAFEFLVYGLREGDQEAIRMQVVSFPRPYFSLESKSIRRINSVITYAGLPSFQDGSLTIKDYIGSNGRSAVEYWQSLAYNVKEDRAGRLADYKKNCDVMEYTPDLATHLGTWHLYGCWVSNISEDEFNNAQKDDKNVTATIVYDKAIWEPSTEYVEAQ